MSYIATVKTVRTGVVRDGVDKSVAAKLPLMLLSLQPHAI